MSLMSLQANSSTDLRVTSRWLSPSVLQVAVAGELDLATVGELQASLCNVMSSALPRCIDVDLAEVRFMDCSGLSVLVSAKLSAARAGCRLHISRPQPLVRRILELTGLLGMLIP